MICTASEPWFRVPCGTRSRRRTVFCYARIGGVSTSRLQPNRVRTGDRLVGIDLARDGLLTFQVSPTTAPGRSTARPVSDGERVCVAMRHSDVPPHAYVACYDAATGRRLWRTSIGAADTPAAGRGDEITHNLLTLVGDRIFSNTNLGLVAALDRPTGRSAGCTATTAWRGTSLPGGRCISTAIRRRAFIDKGLVIRRPGRLAAGLRARRRNRPDIWVTDGSRTRFICWASSTERSSSAAIGCGAVNARSGRTRLSGRRASTPESAASGAARSPATKSSGRRAIEIYVFDAVTGERTRSPIDLAPYSDSAQPRGRGRATVIVGPRQSWPWVPSRQQRNRKNQTMRTRSR